MQRALRHGSGAACVLKCGEEHHMPFPSDKGGRGRPGLPPVSAKPAAKPAARPVVPPPAPVPKHGRVTHDARGNAQWDLGMSTTAIRRLSRTGLLRKLDSSELSVVEDTAVEKKLPEKPTRVEGFNPYDRSLPPKRPRR
jgi:hypothetical protein